MPTFKLRTVYARARAVEPHKRTVLVLYSLKSLNSALQRRVCRSSLRPVPRAVGPRAARAALTKLQSNNVAKSCDAVMPVVVFT